MADRVEVRFDLRVGRPGLRRLAGEAHKRGKAVREELLLDLALLDLDLHLHVPVHHDREQEVEEQEEEGEVEEERVNRERLAIPAPYAASYSIIY